MYTSWKYWTKLRGVAWCSWLMLKEQPKDRQGVKTFASAGNRQSPSGKETKDSMQESENMVLDVGKKARGIVGNSLVNTFRRSPG